MLSADRPATRLATRILFLIAGFGYSCWAPLVPFSKAQLGIDEHVLGLLFLCIGLGSISAMTVAGALTMRFGNRPIIIVSGFGFAISLAMLPLCGSTFELGLNLAAFGATLGTLDVAMNLHAIDVERAASQPLMSGFHALFSIGGFAGSAIMTVLLSMQFATLHATVLCASAMVAGMLFAMPRLLNDRGSKEGPLFAVPHGAVMVIAALAAITFLVEGALLDWSALLITRDGMFSLAQGGVGYMVFSIAMTVGRLTGDAVTARVGDRRAMVSGGVIALAGFVVLLTAANSALVLGGFALIGLGCSNIVPVLFRRAATQKVMPPALALSAISTTAYAGILAGPAGIGWVAKAVGLPTAFWMLAGLFALVPCFANVVIRRSE